MENNPTKIFNNTVINYIIKYKELSTENIYLFKIFRPT